MAQGEGKKYYRETPVDDIGLAIRRFFSTNFLLRCPACGQESVAKGVFGVKDRCPNCGSRFERLPGNFLISIALNFFLTSVGTVVAAVLLVRARGFFPELSWILIGLICVAAVLFLRPVRVLTLWLLWLLGFVYPDGEGAVPAPRGR